MGVADVPQWLPAAFVRSCKAVGASAGRDEIETTCRRLLERWKQPDRHFHNDKHLVDMLARLDEIAEETHNPDLVRLAAWYHGAIFSSVATKAYTRSGGEDEVASAELAREELGGLGVPEPALDRVEQLILGLKRHEAKAKDIDCLALSDADLAVLASDPQKYQAYRKKVRAEYAHIPLRHYLEARIAIIGKLLARRNIFVSPMGQQWEDAARENLSAELDRLRAELGELGSCAPEETVAAAEAAHEHAADAAAAEGHTVRDDAPAASVTPDAPAARETSRAPAGPTGTDVPIVEPAPVRAAVSPDPATTTVRPHPEPAGAEQEPAPAPDEAGGTDRQGAASVRRGDEERVLASSLESLPDDLAPRPRTEPSEGDRATIARSSRDLVEHAVRTGRMDRERAERLKRERLDVTRALREQGALPERERRERTSTLTPASPRSAPTPDSTRGPRKVQPRAPHLPSDRSDEPPPGDGRAASPQHGIEREPDFLTRPRKKKKGSRKDRPS